MDLLFAGKLPGGAGSAGHLTGNPSSKALSGGSWKEARKSRVQSGASRVSLKTGEAGLRDELNPKPTPCSCSFSWEATVGLRTPTPWSEFSSPKHWQNDLCTWISSTPETHVNHSFRNNTLRTLPWSCFYSPLQNTLQTSRTHRGDFRRKMYLAKTSHCGDFYVPLLNLKCLKPDSHDRFCIRCLFEYLRRWFLTSTYHRQQRALSSNLKLETPGSVPCCPELTLQWSAFIIAL